MTLRLSTSTRTGAAVVSAAGEIDLHTAPALRAEVDRALQADPRALEIDLTEVTFIDSSGLGALLGVKKRTTAAGTSLVLRNLAPAVMRILAVTRMTDVFTIVDGPDPV